MRHISLVLSCICGLMLIACSEKQSDATSEKQDLLWQNQVDTLEKGKKVEQVLKESETHRREEMEQQGR